MGQPLIRDNSHNTIGYTANEKLRTAKLKPIEYSATTPKFPKLIRKFR
jgi:hypothetical protein